MLFGPTAVGAADGTAKAGIVSSHAADVATLLFEQSMWQKAGVGSELRYGFSRKVSGGGRKGSFDDDVLLELLPGDSDDTRTSAVSMFTGAKSVAAGPFFSTRVNPVLLLMLEQNVQELSHLTGARPSDLKNAIRIAWRDAPSILDTPVEVRGQRVPGLRISITPFAKEPTRAKMKGLDQLIYTVELADSVPGRIAGINIYTPVGAPTVFSERLRYAGGKPR